MRRRTIILSLVGAGLLLLLGVPLAIALWLASLHPVPDHNYAEDVIRIHETWRPDGADDARALIEQARDLMWARPPDHAAINEVVARLAEVQWASEPGFAAPSLQDIRTTVPALPVARACLWRMRKAWQEGDADGVERNLAAVFALAHVFHTRPLRGNIGALLEHQVVEQMRAAIILDGTTPDVVQAALRAVSDRPSRPPLGPALASEGRLEALDFIQHTYTADPQRGVFLPTWSGWDGYETEAASFRQRLSNYRGFDAPRRGELTRLVNDYFDGVATIQTWREHKQVALLNVEFDAGLKAAAPHLEHVTFFAPAAADAFRILSSLSIYRERDRDLEGLLLMLRIESARHETGALPDSLAALDFRATEADWLYRRIDAASDPHGRHYLLYLAGQDGVDNGGVSDGSISAPQSVRVGSDWIFNRPDPSPLFDPEGEPSG
ncbi:MAG: hypothetical protein KDA21_11120 [Phycisphaerales bacterium]|nr:hypothetical protein [Phycisphaerales bacterium]